MWQILIKRDQTLEHALLTLVEPMKFGLAHIVIILIIFPKNVERAFVLLGTCLEQFGHTLKLISKVMNFGTRRGVAGLL